MPQDSVSVSVDSGYSAAVMATRWISEFRAMQHPQRKKMTTTLAVVRSDTLSTVASLFLPVALWVCHTCASKY